MKIELLTAIADELTDEDLSALLYIVKDRLTVWAPSTDDDSVFPAKVLGTYANTASSDRGVSLLLKDEDDG